MTSLKLHTFLVHPGKGINPLPGLSGTELSGSGKLIDLLTNIFRADPDLRDFEVTFKPADDGTQENICRTLILQYQKAPTLTNAQQIVERLRDVTDRRSGIGLVFIMNGQHGIKNRTVISRFPANEAILAQVDAGGLDVEFLDQVFIRKMSAYKAIMLEDADPSAKYWSGYATDRQAGGAPENISGYWLDEFLAADFSETPKAGTKRLADALKKAVKANPNLSVKTEIASAVSLAPTALKGKMISIDDFCLHFGLSEDAVSSIKGQMRKPSLVSKKFKFDEQEFMKTVPYRSVEMDSGAILTAPSDEFDEVFAVTEESEGKVRISTEGRVSDQRMAKR